MEKLGIRIDPILPYINLKVPQEMSENIQDEDERSPGNNKFFPDGRLVKGD